MIELLTVSQNESLESQLSLSVVMLMGLIHVLSVGTTY